MVSPALPLKADARAQKNSPVPRASTTTTATRRPARQPSSVTSRKTARRREGCGRRRFAVVLGPQGTEEKKKKSFALFTPQPDTILAPRLTFGVPASVCKKKKKKKKKNLQRLLCFALLLRARAQASGVAVTDDVVEAYQALKLGHTFRYVIFKLNDELTEVVVEKKAGPDASYNDFCAELPANDCRYAIFDFAYDHKGEGTRNKILFVVWAPDSAKIKAKMLYASTKDAVRKKLVGIGVEIQATDVDEIDHSTVLERVLR